MYMCVKKQKRVTVLRNIRNMLESILEEEAKAKQSSGKDSSIGGGSKIVDERNGTLIANVKDTEHLLGLVQKCIVDKCQYRLSNGSSGDVSLYLSYADSHFYEFSEDDHSYLINDPDNPESGKKIKKNAEEMVQFYNQLATKHSDHISYLEDPIHKQDSDCWIDLTQSLQSNSQTANTNATSPAKVIGNSIFESVPEHVQPAIANVTFA
ncbi:hypothetical protein RFI_02052 [Reticulomyxa filosa]|uniref:phosphopyruvate hydratase n=1 Tax=Reticulomyxa filosa TaxID=46433 RepID=X6PA11_RETFI|nr:hypothetical protein RFI_02052 [Reticulomyxa filosa]|eukprot:ETO35021.1 hypothetical protein RFI_02052 [Reticulomyxa filosa]